MGVAEVREGEFLFLWPQFGNKCSFADQANIFVLRWNKAILLSERRMKTVGHHWQEGALAVLARPLGVQSGAGSSTLGGAERDAASALCLWAIRNANERMWETRVLCPPPPC